MAMVFFNPLPVRSSEWRITCLPLDSQPFHTSILSIKQRENALPERNPERYAALPNLNPPYSEKLQELPHRSAGRENETFRDFTTSYKGKWFQGAMALKKMG